jgi:hypothetical protein
MRERLVMERRGSLQQKAAVARQEVQRLRQVLLHGGCQADQRRVEGLLRSWRWDGLKSRMSGYTFSSYVGAPTPAQISLPPEVEQLFDQDAALGLGLEFVEALLAEYTLQGVRALQRFYQLIGADALYISVARRAFSAWAAYEVLGFEDATFRRPEGGYHPSAPGMARSDIPTFYLYTFHKRSDWEETTGRWIFDPLWWPSHCPDPFWAALCDRDLIPTMRARFEPERFPRRPTAPQRSASDEVPRGLPRTRADVM